MEFLPKSGIINEYPEIDRAEWVDIQTCKKELYISQVALIDELLEKLNRLNKD